MPIYTYRDVDGRELELLLRWADWDRLDGGRGEIEVGDELRAATTVPDHLADGDTLSRVLVGDLPGAPPPGNWPMTSLAAGVHPDQSKELERVAREKGVPTEVKNGEPVFRTREHRRKYLKAFGYYDRDACYGDT